MESREFNGVSNKPNEKKDGNQETDIEDVGLGERSKETEVENRASGISVQETEIDVMNQMKRVHKEYAKSRRKKKRKRMSDDDDGETAESNDYVDDRDDDVSYPSEDESNGDDDLSTQSGNAERLQSMKSSSPRATKGKKRARVQRHTWTAVEKTSLERQFMDFIKRGKTPGQIECLNAMKKEKALAHFTWRHVKFAVKNIITSRQRMFTK